MTGRAPSFASAALLLLACGSDTTTSSTPIDASTPDTVVTPPNDASADATGLDAQGSDGATEAATDAGDTHTDACGTVFKGPHLWLIGVDVGSGTDLFRVYPEAENDELFAHVETSGGKKATLEDFSIDEPGHRIFAIDFNNYFEAALPKAPQPVFDLGMPLAYNAPPPQLAYWIGSKGLFLGRGTTNLFRITIANGMVDWLYLGDVPAPGGSCGVPRDFISGIPNGNGASYLAFCSGGVNSVVDASWSTAVDGGPVTTSKTSNPPALAKIPDKVLGAATVPGTASEAEITGSDLYVDGVKRRPLRYCAAAPNIIAPIGSPRAIE